MCYPQQFGRTVLLLGQKKIIESSCDPQQPVRGPLAMQSFEKKKKQLFWTE